MTSHRTTVLLLLAPAAMFLAGCAAQPQAQAPTPDLTTAYLSMVHVAVPSMTNTDALRVGHEACALLDTTPTMVTYTQLFTQDSTAALTGHQYKLIVDSAISAFCPAHTNLRAAFEAR